MVFTLIDHRNDAIKCSRKLKWNHEPQAGKMWSICFYSNIYFSLVVASQATFFMLFFVFLLYLCSFMHQLTEISPHMLKIGSSLSMLRSKIFLRKTKNKTTGTAWPVTSFPWSILWQTITLDQSTQNLLSYGKKAYEPEQMSWMIFFFLFLLQRPSGSRKAKSNWTVWKSKQGN